jgi:subtilisin family serine protease
MRIFTFSFVTVLLINLAFPQSSVFNDNSPTDVVKLDSRTQQFEFIPGVILVKLNDDALIGLAKKNGFSVTGISSVDVILQKYKVTSAEKLFPDAEKLVEKQIFISYNRKTFERPSLHNIYRLQITNEQELFKAIDELKQDPNVVYAEPDYVLSLVNNDPLSPPLSEAEMLQWLENHPDAVPKLNKDKNTNSPLIITPNDPLYSQQWGIPACQIDAVWDSTSGDSTQIIAILDSGVDWTHPDLKDNIWINYPEANGLTGNDDDHNGYIDDIRGWNFIGNNNNPADDNSHGTHVAGIIAAEGNNGIGIAGVNWHAKIMPVKVFQSNGKGDVAVISQGINYAAMNGATIINMSFGTYARSLTMENALANAYATSVLVAAAGNDGICIGPGKCPDNKDSSPFYPAALSYVLGVEAPPPPPFGFSNYDVDGPVYSAYPELFNYELKAPGTSIISTIPNGNYRVYSGTSMAAPMVSGAVSLYRHFFPTQSQELLWGNLINSLKSYIQLSDAINQSPKPVLNFVSSTIVDTISGDDHDGNADAGETIELWYKVRNTWGQSDSVFVGIRFGEFEDTSVVQILKNSAFIGSISAYATRTNELNPLKIKIPSGVANNRAIVFQALIWYKNSPDTVKQQIVITVENGVQLSGIIDGTLTLTANKNYIVSNSLMISPTGVLNINPGVILNIYDGKSITNFGVLNAVGNKDSMIVFKANGPYGWRSFNLNGDTYLRFCNISGLIDYGLYSYDYSKNIQISDCQFIYNNTGGSDLNLYGNSYIQRTNFYYNNSGNCLGIRANANYEYTFDNLNIIDNISTGGPSNYVGLAISNYGDATYSQYNRINCLNNTSGTKISDLGVTSYMGVMKIPPIYFGTSDSNKIGNYIWDFFDDGNLPAVNYANYLKVPSDSAHGFVWKVLINGKDPQDEKVDPIGAGPQKFDVWFNREMNPLYTPQLSFGVKDPYTQQFVADSSHWSIDHKTWTAYKTVQLYTGDGINRLRVSGARDLDNFEIPVESARFQFLIDAAGSSSNGFSATAGLGKVALTWESPEGVKDLLGYNLYRFNNITDTTLTNPALLNSSLVTDSVFTDYTVIPNKKYYYYYKVVRTDFSESDSSKIVSSIPFTAALGDANGDLSVSVLDILTDVSYILGQNPQPFIFDAADVVRDSSINVLDVVGTVNIVLHGSLKKYLAKQTYGNAKLELVGNTLKLTSDIPLSGIQLKIKGTGINNIQFVNQGPSGFELAAGNRGDTLKTIIYYSMNNSELSPGSYVLGTLQGVQSTVYLTEAILADKNGNNVLTSVIDNGVSLIPTEYYLDQNFPNPFNMQTIIQYGVPQKTVGRIAIYNVLGQRIKTFELGDINPGRFRIQWDGKNNYGSVVSSGVYIYRFESQKFISAKKLLLLK